MKKFFRVFLLLPALSVAAFLSSAQPAHAEGVLASATSVVAGAVGGVLADIGGLAIAPLAYVLFTIASVTLWLAGMLFNWTVIRTVFQFGVYFGTSDGMLVAWKVIRDISNIGLLFGFIFMGLLLILNVEGGGHGHSGGLSAKKAIPRLIIFAILLNFSLFASQAVIDVANGFASVFAEQAGYSCKGLSDEACANIGISGKVLALGGLTSTFNFNTIGSYFSNPFRTAITFILLTAFTTVAAMVLFAAAIMLVVRAITLCMLMITSPVGFAGLAIPGLSKVAKDWWHNLINQAFFAPIYLLLLFISIRVADGLGNGQSLAAALLSSDGIETAGAIQVVLVFTLVIGFMVASLVVAQKMGAYGAKFATQSAAGLTFGAQSFVARRTVGRASGKVAERLRSSALGHTEMGRLFTTIADKGAKSSFDARGIKGVSKVGGLDLGTQQKGGYDAIVHHGQEEREKYAKGLKQTTADKEAEKELKDQKDALEDRRELLGDSPTDKAQKVAINKEIKALDEKLKAAASAPQLRYADSLDKSAHQPWNQVTAGGRASHHASDTIKKSAKKDKFEKAFDDWKNSGSGAPKPAPTPAAPASGGGAPSGGGGGHH